MIREILDSGADPDAIDDDNKTALYRASWGGWTENVTCLFKAGGNPNICVKGCTGSPLHAVADSVSTLQALLSYHAEVDFVDDTRAWIALTRVAYWESVECLRTLIEHNANVNIVA